MKEINNIDDLYESIGGFGKFQLIALVGILYPELPCGIIALLPVFVGSHPKLWTCTEESGYKYSINSTFPTDEVFCHCDGTLDGGKSSIISEWDLVCDYAWVTDFITSIQMTGMMIGASFGSQIPDWIGRKKALYSFCLIVLTMGTASGFVTSPYLYAATRFFIGLCISPTIIANTIYVIEILPSSSRTLCGCLGPWAIGVMILPVLAYYIPSWQTLTWIAAVPMALQFLTYPFVPESPRWLLQKGKVTEAKEAINKIAHWNGYPPVDEKIIEKLAFQQNQKDPEEQLDDFDDDKRKNPKVGVWKILTNATLRLKLLKFICIWFVIGLIYYWTGFGSKNLGGNPYLNLVYVGLVEQIGFPTAIFANKWFGRRRALMGYLLFATVPLIGIVLMEIDLIPYYEEGITYLSLIGRLFICGGWGAVKCFTAESFTTDTRATAIGISTISASLGGVLAPQIIFLGTMYEPIPYFILCGLAVIGTGLAFLLNETKGKALET